MPGTRNSFRPYFRVAHGWSATLLAGPFLLAAGCSGQSDSKAVFGVVNFQGNPIESGTITFVPEDARAAQVASGNIAEGSYVIPAEHKLVPGASYRIEITALRKTGRTRQVPVGLMQLPDSASGKTYEELEEFIPPKYNVASTLKVTLSDSTAKEECNFELQ